MKTLVTSDLDRTLIYSKASAGADFERFDPVCVEMYNNAPLSYMAAAAHGSLAALATRAAVVPTTTRTPAQYQRVRLPGAPHRYAICSNGGELLVDGVPDAAWRAGIDAELAALPAALPAMTAELAGRLDPAWAPTLRAAEGLFCYAVSEVRVPDATVTAWRAYCQPRGWSVSQQGRKLYTIPRPLTKSRAAAEVRRRLIAEGTLAPDARWLAAGDGALDADLLDAADAAIRPRHGELHELGFTRTNLALTTTDGIAAGLEIVAWLAERAERAERRERPDVPRPRSRAVVTTESTRIIAEPGAGFPIRTSAQE